MRARIRRLLSHKYNWTVNPILTNVRNLTWDRLHDPVDNHEDLLSNLSSAIEEAKRYERDPLIYNDYIVMEKEIHNISQ